jgi:hypothetical protein
VSSGTPPCAGCGQAVLCDACAEPEGHAAALHRDECAALGLLFTSPHTRQLDAGTAAVADGGRAGIRLLLRLVYARARQRRPDAGLPPSPAELSELDVIQDSFDDVWSLEEHWDDFSDDVAERLVDMAKQAKFVCSADARGNLEESVSLLSHCYSNAFKLPARPIGAGGGGGGSVGVGVFVSASFLNHSCDPNCAWEIDGSGFLAVHARRPVRQGELLTISYIDTGMARAARRA